MADLTGLYRRASFLFEAAWDQPWLVQNSIPILFSGNLGEYLSSDFKILTVALNPSNFEFLQSGFYKPYDIQNYRPDYSARELENAYSSYFERCPYTTWFNSYERLLQRLGASYYGASYPGKKLPRGWGPKKNRVLHTDLCSPLVTRPNWTNLDRQVRSELTKTGRNLWCKLVGILKPNLILASVGKAHRPVIDVSICWEELPRFNHVNVARLGGALIVQGGAGRRPFSRISNEELPSLAKEISARL